MRDNHKYSARWRDRTLKRILYNRERTAPNGAGETERRRKQIAAGRLKPENGLVQVNPAGWQEVDGVALPPITWAEPTGGDDAL